MVNNRVSRYALSIQKVDKPSGCLFIYSELVISSRWLLNDFVKENISIHLITETLLNKFIYIIKKKLNILKMYLNEHRRHLRPTTALKKEMK